MNRPALALLLLAASAPAFASPSDPTPAIADPQHVADTFAELCIRAPHAWAAANKAKDLGAVPVTGEDAVPPPGVPAHHRFTMQIDGVETRIAVSDAVCGVDVTAVDAKATLKRLDKLIDETYGALRRFKPAGDRSDPPSGKVVRDVHYAMPDDTSGVNFLVVATGERGAQGLVMARRFVSVATGDVQPIDFAASEDLAGRALAPPRYPDAALRACAGGMVVMIVTIDDKGAVLEVVVESSSGRSDLDAAAIDAVKNWRFNPGIRDGVLVGGKVRVPVRFTPPCSD